MKHFHFPLFILGLSFAIAACSAFPAMANDKCHMENGK